MARTSNGLTLSGCAATALRPRLDSLCGATDVSARLARDPLWWPRRYRDPADVEVAAFFASALAYGRVSLFWPVLVRIFAAADAAGGPARWAGGVKAKTDLEPLIYRWNRGPDLILLGATVKAAQAAFGTVGTMVERAHDPKESLLAPSLDRVIGQLRALAMDEARAMGLDAGAWEALPRGFRTFFPTPAEGSACKRWNMLLRWMVRPPGQTDPSGVPIRADGVDLGLWRLPPAKLIIPLDTHVGRIAGLLGLHDRADDGWRTAEQITNNLALLDPDDPVRFDFALAHLGISGACQRRPVPEICRPCALRPVCSVGRGVADASANE